jgi:hypothetical protein
MMSLMSDIMRVAQVGVEIPTDSDRIRLLLMARNADTSVRVDMSRDEAVRFYQKGESNLLDPAWHQIGHSLRQGALKLWFTRPVYENLIGLVRSAVTEDWHAPAVLH